jgi:hypothetical protein
MSRIRLLAPLSVLVLAASACDGASVVQPTAVPGDPSLLVGPTARVEVYCPTPIEDGNAGQCYAYGYDSAGTYTNSSVSSWWSGNTTVASVSSGGYLSANAVGNATIYATIDGITGWKSVTVTSATPLTVQLQGSETAEAGDYDCYFWATASGGTGSGYTYSWSVSGGWGTASGSTWTGGGTGDFTLTVTVTDSGSQQAQDSIFVDVFPAGTFGMPCIH